MRGSQRAGHLGPRVEGRFLFILHSSPSTALRRKNHPLLTQPNLGLSAADRKEARPEVTPVPQVAARDSGHRIPDSPELRPLGPSPAAASEVNLCGSLPRSTGTSSSSSCSPLPGLLLPLFDASACHQGPRCLSLGTL